MEAKSIKKISDAELTEAALDYAQSITKVIENKKGVNQKFLDSLNRVYDVQIIFMKPGDSGLRAIERQVIEAYNFSSVSSSDNLQKMGNDSLLYTKPLMKKLPDGSVEFAEVLAVRIHKKAVILSIKNWLIDRSFEENNCNFGVPIL